MFSSEFVGETRHDDIEFPVNEDPCAPDDGSRSPDQHQLMDSLSPACLPIHRCRHALRLLSLPTICGWSGLLPDVCCPPEPLSLHETTVVSTHSQPPDESASDASATGSSDCVPPRTLAPAQQPPPSPPPRVRGTGTREQATKRWLVPQTMTTSESSGGRETSATKESISSITSPPEQITTAIMSAEAAGAAAVSEAPFTGKASIGSSYERTTASSLTSALESLASREGAAAAGAGGEDGVALTPATSDSQEETPEPLIAYRNSGDCGASDDDGVWPFLVSSRPCV